MQSSPYSDLVRTTTGLCDLVAGAVTRSGKKHSKVRRGKYFSNVKTSVVRQSSQHSVKVRSQYSNFEATAEKGGIRSKPTDN